MSSPESGGGVILLGLAAFGVLAWASRTGVGLDRTLDPGDVVFMSVFAIFGSFCVFMGWRLFRSQPNPRRDAAAQVAPASPPKRVTLSTRVRPPG